ncbi:MAG: hypothetical protein U1C46_04305 [Bacteroidales bacterium]|nr:hypothetical protein [Bacteroidales bacterium]MDZ4204026.1 hypothetical protein [Bacteroidales bacterium]
MESVSVLISGIEYKIRKLSELHRVAQHTITLLTKKIEEQEININQQTLIINELQEKLENINITKTIASRYEIAEAKSKIGELVREIDKCIGLLNK